MERTEKVKGYCAQCGSICGTEALVRDGRLISVRVDKSHPNRGFCVKAEAAPEIVYNEGRLKFPMKRTNPKDASDPGWVRISWDEALAEASRRLLQIKAESGAESIAFSRPTPGGSHAADWTPWSIRLANSFGSPNFITTTHVCQWGRDAGSAYTYGVGLPTPHFEEAKAILIWGHNPAVSHLQNWQGIKQAQRRGARLLVVDPRRSETAARADLWIAPKPGTDAALLLGIIRFLIHENLYDDGFMRFWTNAPFLINPKTGKCLRSSELSDQAQADGYVVWDERKNEAASVDVLTHPNRWDVSPALGAKTQVRLRTGEQISAKTAFQMLREKTDDFTLERVAAISGVPQEQLIAFAKAIGTESPLCYYTFNGIEQHINTAQTNRALCILYALTGCFDGPGGNVQFASPPSHHIGGPELLGKETLAKRVGLAERPLGAARVSAQAYTFYDAVLDAKPYKIRALLSFGANIMLQNADSQRGREALEKLDFFVHVDMFDNPSSQYADILLPAATCWESPALRTTFAGGPSTVSYMQYRKATIEPLYESRPDMQIIFDLAMQLGLGDKFWDGDIVTAFKWVLEPTGVSFEQLKDRPGGMNFDLPQRFRKYAEVDKQGQVRGFQTPTRKMEIYSEQFLLHGYDPLPGYDEPIWTQQGSSTAQKYPLIFTSAKLTQYCHSQGRGIPMLRRRVPEPFAEIHPETAMQYSIGDGDRVTLSTPQGSIHLRCKITERTQPGVIAAQTGWWEPCEELDLPGYDPFSAEGANVCLIINNDSLDPISGSVPAKAYPCSIARAS